MNWYDAKNLRETRNQKLADMKAMLTKCETEKRSLDAVENTAFDKLNTEAEGIKSTLDKVDQVRSLELAAGTVQFGREDVGTPEQRGNERALEYRAQFGKFLRGASPSELRALTVTGAGVVGDQAFATNIVDKMKAYAGVLQAGCEVLNTANGNPFGIPTTDDTGNEGRLVGEAVPNAVETLPTLGNVQIGALKFDSDWIKVSIELLQDAAYDVEGYVARKTSERIGRAFNRYTTVGTGVGQPQGFVTGGTLGATSAAAGVIDGDDILNLIHSLDSAYRANGAKLMLNDGTLCAIRKLKDLQGRYIWQPGMNGALLATIFDASYVVNSSMASLSDVEGKVLAYGDFSRYTARRVSMPMVIRANELFISDGLIGFKTIERLDGKVTDASAIKYLKLHV